MIQNQEFIQDFVDEAVVHLQNVEFILIGDTNINEDKEKVNTLFRAVHSVKGTAGFFGLSNIVNLSHSIENIFGEVRKNNITLNDKMIQVLLVANGKLFNLVNNVFESENEDIQIIINDINQIFEDSTKSSAKEERNVCIKVDSKDIKMMLSEYEYQMIQEKWQEGFYLYDINETVMSTRIIKFQLSKSNLKRKKSNISVNQK